MSRIVRMTHCRRKPIHDASPLIDRRHLDFTLYEIARRGSPEPILALRRSQPRNFRRGDRTGAQIAVEKFLPHNRKSDLNEPHMVDGKVELIPEIGEGVAALQRGRLLRGAGRHGRRRHAVAVRDCAGLRLDVLGGQCRHHRLPGAGARRGQPARASTAPTSRSACTCSRSSTGRYFGTMCLSEPQAGSSLSDITHHAPSRRPTAATGSAAPRCGSPAGDHELGENIVHLVLARIDGAPAGVTRHQPVHRAALARQRRRQPRRAQRRRAGRPQPQDGPARQRQHLPQVRRARRLPRPNWSASRTRAWPTCST